MTPKEKAGELVEKMLLNQEQSYEGAYIGYKEAKQCALIAVDEIIKSREDDGHFDDKVRLPDSLVSAVPGKGQDQYVHLHR